MNASEAEALVKKSHPTARLQCDRGWMRERRDFIYLIVEDVRFPPRWLTNRHKTPEAAWLTAAKNVRKGDKA